MVCYNSGCKVFLAQAMKILFEKAFGNLCEYFDKFHGWIVF